MDRAECVLASLKCKHCQKADLDVRLIPAILALETAIGEEVKITARYRCKVYNQSLIDRGLHASMKSRHMDGLAVDIFCLKKKQKDVVAAARSAGFTGIGWGSNFLHLDLRDEPAEWWY